MSRQTVILVIFILFPLQNFALESTSDIQNLVNQYYKIQHGFKINSLALYPMILPSLSNRDHRILRRSALRQERQEKCIETVCEHLSRFDCDDRDDMMEVGEACRNVDGECVRSMCSRMTRFACDEKLELFEITTACRGLTDVSCIDYVCARMGRFACDSIAELKEVARRCK